jgi:hypothetical protein
MKLRRKIMENEDIKEEKIIIPNEPILEVKKGKKINFKLVLIAAIIFILVSLATYFIYEIYIRKDSTNEIVEEDPIDEEEPIDEEDPIDEEEPIDEEDPAANNEQPVMQLDMEKFNFNDFIINSKSIDPGNFRTILGDPKTITPETEGEDGDVYYTYFYDGLTISHLSETSFIYIEVTTNKYTGPRGLKVGDTREKVLSLFKEDRKEDYHCQPFGEYVERFDIEYIYPSSERCNYYKAEQEENSILATGFIQYAYETRSSNVDFVAKDYIFEYFVATPPYLNFDEYTIYDYSTSLKIEFENNIVTNFLLSNTAHLN